MILSFAKSSYRDLLKDSRFKLWLENVERGSVITCAEYFRRMGFLCKEFGTTPAGIARLRGERAADFLQEVISHFEQLKCAPTNTKGYARALKSWWKYNGIRIDKDIKIAGLGDGTKYDRERVPTQEELPVIFDTADMRAKVAIALMAFCGFRVQTLGNFLGTDGLEAGDLPEMSVRGETVEFERIPALVICRRQISKKRHEYVSFLPAQGCQYLKQYLEQRIRSGERITQRSPIITALESNPRKVGCHIRSTNVGDLIRKPVRSAGFDWRPYVMRRYFDTAMMIAESEGLIIRDWRVFWMGHKGDIEHVYTLNKRLPPILVERMRKAYENSERHLVTSEGRRSSDRILETFNSQFLTIAGYTREEMENLGDLGKLSVDQVKDLLKAKSMQSLGLNGNKQKVVPEDEAKAWLAQGWEFVSHLSAGEVIVRLPA